MQLPDKLFLQDFDYDLPSSFIAQFPLAERDASKLLVYNKGDILSRKFTQIAGFLPANAKLLMNNSKVVPARLYFTKETGSVIEVFLLEPHGMEYSMVFNQCQEVCFKALVGNKKRWKEGQQIYHEDTKSGLRAQWENRDSQIVTLQWDSGEDFGSLLARIGNLPLPPYLNRPSEPADYESYQTVYADVPGAVAAPTAGLHFTPSVLAELARKQVAIFQMTLHVSAGTFLPVTSENALDHPMHREVFYITKESIAYVLDAECLIPVGTTSMRMAESLYWIGVRLYLNEDNPFDLPQFYAYQEKVQNIGKEQVKQALLLYMENHRGDSVEAYTRIMIVPGYVPQVCRGLITNFHQPQSTLVMLIASLLGSDWERLYAEAKAANYRFLSYGDSSLLLW